MFNQNFLFVSLASLSLDTTEKIISVYGCFLCSLL